jgi:iron(III) transport system ATP-binding protein
MIIVEHISKSYGKVNVLTDISFKVDTGRALALVGPSGSGKTTILRLLAGFEIPNSGQIIIGNKVVSTKEYTSPPHERGIGMVFQKPALWPHMTLEQNVRFGLSGLNRDEILERIKELFHLTHLDGLEKRYPYQVSGGEAQRATLARAIAPKPDILFLDEPMIGLDNALKTEMIEILRETRQTAGVTIIYVSHDYKEAQLITDQVVQLSHGKICYNGSWDGLI